MDEILEGVHAELRPILKKWIWADRVIFFSSGILVLDILLAVFGKC